MKKNMIFLLMFLASMGNSYSQQSKAINNSQFVDLAGTVGASQGTVAASYVYNWKLGRNKKLEIGIGGRWTTYYGSKKDFLTAGPAKYTRSFTVPFLIFFAGQEEQNFDTLTLQRPLTHSINATINLGYSFNPKWYIGFNIDAIGVTFGRKTSGILTSNGITRTDPSSKPPAFNILLTGDHDRGTLNSEFLLRYKIAPRWSLKAIYQFVFVEYQSQTIQQRFSDGKTNDRFRNKANNIGLGVSYFLN